MTAAKVINRLVSLIAANGNAIRRINGWDGTRGGACVLMTRIGCDVLGAFSVQAEPFPVSMVVGNAIWVSWVKQGCPGDPPVGAYGRGDPQTLGTSVSESEYAGHVVVRVPAQQTILDLDLRSWARPEKGIVIPYAAALQWASDEIERHWDFGNGVRIEMASRPEAVEYRQSDYWRIAPTETVRELVRAIRKGQIL